MAGPAVPWKEYSSPVGLSLPAIALTTVVATRPAGVFLFRRSAMKTRNKTIKAIAAAMDKSDHVFGEEECKMGTIKDVLDAIQLAGYSLKPAAGSRQVAQARQRT
jgi:hypothetical protein